MLDRARLNGFSFWLTKRECRPFRPIIPPGRRFTNEKFMPRVAKKSAKPRGKAKKNEVLEGLPDEGALSAPVEESTEPRSSEDLHPPGQAPEASDEEEPAAPLRAEGKDGQTINISQLQAMSMAELNSMAKEMGIENFGTMRKHEVIFQILQKNAERSGILFAEGVLEILPEGFGFLRSQSFNYLPCPEDIYVSP